MKTANDPIDSNRPFLTRLGLRIVAIISGCVAAALLAYLIMLPVMLIGIKLGPGLGSTAWGLGIFAGYIVYRQLCKRFKLTLRSKSGVDALFEKDENEVDNSASTLYEGGSEKTTDGNALIENVNIAEEGNAKEAASEIEEEVTMNESEITVTEDSIAEDVEVSQSEERFKRNDVESSRTKALDDTEMRNVNTTIESDKTIPNKAPTRRNTKLIKKIFIIIASIVSAVCLFFVIRACYLPIHCKTKHKILVQTIEGKITDGTIIRNELEEALKQNKQCESRRFCKFDHSKAQQEMIDLYIQYLEEYCKTNIDKADSITKEMFKWDQSELDQYFTYDNGNEYRYYDKNEIGVKVAYYSIVAFSILSYAAEHGDSDSQLSLGLIYEGVNCSSDNEEKPWRNYTMIGEKVDPVKAAYWYLQAANQGNSSAMGNIGSCYLEGHGVSKNLYKGCYWVQRAANLGDPFHQRRLGDLYRDGVVEKSYHTEKRKNYYWGYDNITVYDYDTIIPKDIKQAMYWWNLAADAGDETAKERLQQIYD
jgi:TPR repeat protein